MGGYSGTSDLDLGKKLEIWIFGMGGGVFWNFLFGLRKKKLEIWIFGMGGYSGKVMEKKTYFTEKLT